MKNPRTRPLLVGLGALALAWTTPSASADEQLEEAITEIREETGVPALAALYFHEGKEVVLVVDGRRDADSRKEVGADDFWHIGSNTKAITAALVGRYVDKGDLTFQTTLAEVFPDWEDKFSEGAGAITIEQLLSHTAGLPANPPGPMLMVLRNTNERVTKQREQIARWALIDEELQSKPGTKFHYSNVGYVIAGAVLEEMFGKPWEKLVAEEVYKPLGIKDFGFGAPDGRNAAGHLRNDDGPKAMTGLLGDNPAAYGPAGTAHLQLGDWMKFVADQTAGARGESGTLLKPETYAELHRPRLDDYALGWIVVANHGFFAHDGSNTLWRSRALFSPERNGGFLIVTNEAGDRGKRALDDTKEALQEFVERQ